MKRLLLGVTILCGSALLGGCPVYSNDRYCDGTGCYDCPSGTTPSNGTCVPWECNSSNDCDPGYVCDATYTCVAAAGPDAGGCGICPGGSVCKLSGGILQCTPTSSFDAGASSDAVAAEAGRADGAYDAQSDVVATDAVSTSPTDAQASFDVSAPVDASMARDSGHTAASIPCNANADCGLDGEKCIDGQCVSESGLCSDTTQCVVSGEACVDGVCEPRCSATDPCPAGYACDFTRAVCDLPATACSGAGTSTCLGGSVCVEGRCVAPCASSGDSSSACLSGQICVNGGCIPDEAARFTCKNDGQGGLLANECAASEVCLHHSCYASCDPDDGGTCADPATTCRQISVTAGTYAACATSSNLGNACDPAIGKYCPTGACVDGYCN